MYTEERSKSYRNFSKHALIAAAETLTDLIFVSKLL